MNLLVIPLEWVICLRDITKNTRHADGITYDFSINYSLAFALQSRSPIMMVWIHFFLVTNLRNFKSITGKKMKWSVTQLKISDSYFYFFQKWWLFPRRRIKKFISKHSYAKLLWNFGSYSKNVNCWFKYEVYEILIQIRNMWNLS